MWRRFWLAETVSGLGTQITGLALPLLAVQTLHATPLQMSLIAATNALPAMLTIPIGVWIDRTSRRRVLIGTDVGQALALSVAPLAALLSVLRIELVYGICLVVGLLDTVDSVARSAFVATSAAPEELEKVNRTSTSVSTFTGMAGKPAAGFLIELVTPVYAIVGDACSFLFSALMLATLKENYRPKEATGERRAPIRLGDGFRFILGSPLLSVLVGFSALGFVVFAAHESQRVLYQVRTLDMDATGLGIQSACGAVGGMVGSFVSSSLRRRAGLFVTFVLGHLVSLAGQAILPFVHGPSVFVLVVLCAGRFFTYFGMGIAFFQAVTLRQSVTPKELQGQVSASAIFAQGVPTLVGALAGGWVATATSPRQALLYAAVAGLAFLVLLLKFRPTLRAPESVAPKDAG